MRYDFSTRTDLTDAELIRLTQAGDESAFAELMSRYNPRISKVVLANSRQHRDAEEILMDVWQAVWENIGGLRSPESFGGWVHRIAYNACKRYYAASHAANDEIPSSDIELARQIDRDAVARFRETERYAEIIEAVHLLPDSLRRVAVLYYLEGRTVKDVHAELGLAVGTIKTKLRQTRERLRKAFGVESQRGGTMSSEGTQTRIKIIGVGGGGGNAVKRMIAAGLTDVEFYLVNTDRDALNDCGGAVPVQIGANTTQGLGCGANPDIGKSAAEEDSETLGALVADADIVFIVAGMGGGTGTGAAPVVAALAQKQGVSAVGIVTAPFAFEGRRRAEQAEHGLEALRRSGDSVVLVPNQGLLDKIGRQLKIREAFELSDEMMHRGVAEEISKFRENVSSS